MQANILFVGGSRADCRLLQEILDGRQMQPLRPAVLRIPDRQALENILAEEGTPFMLVIDTGIGRTQWESLLTHAVDLATPCLLFGEDYSQLDAADTLALGVSGLLPGGSGGLLGIAQLATKLACQMAESQAQLRSSATDDQAQENKLLYAISHDFQAPLQLSHRYAKVLEEDFQTSLGDDGSRILSHLLANLGRTQEMLDELLDYSRLQANETRLQEIDLNQLLDETLDLFQLELDEIGAKVVHDPLPHRYVDRRQFQRLLQNLIGNAIKFRSERPLLISIHYKETDDEWHLSVRDNGIGIQETDTDKLFDMFKRGQTEREYPGSGMGLALCKRIIDNHHGRIWASSEKDNGCSINISLPKNVSAN